MSQAHLSELSCVPGSSWLLQLQHLGATLARLQRLTDTLNNRPAAAPAGNQQQQAASSQQIALAVAAGVLQPVVLALQLVVSDAAAAAVVAASDPRFRKVCRCVCVRPHRGLKEVSDLSPSCHCSTASSNLLARPAMTCLGLEEYMQDAAESSNSSNCYIVVTFLL